MEIVYKKGAIPQAEDVKRLYEDAGWTAYTSDMASLMDALSQSLLVVTAWDKGVLVGLSRSVGDGLTIVYIQDILVLGSHQRKGIGSRMMQEIMEVYQKVRQKVLLTDDSTETRGFYQALGFMPCNKADMVAYVKFGR